MSCDHEAGEGSECIPCLFADLRAQLAAVEKERDEAADSYEITLARMAENCTERQGERDAIAARVAQLEADLERAMDDANKSFKFATNDAIRSAAGRVYCSKCYDAVMGALLGDNGTEEP